jgi:SAM-dependent methyltransferase
MNPHLGTRYEASVAVPRSLLIGCGRNHTKQVCYDGKTEWTGELTTMDMNPDVSPDIVYDMERITQPGVPPGVYPITGSLYHLPFDENTFDEIGAYNCMEHWGKQGDWRGWFAEMGEYHRILKPGGSMSILVPIGPDALADPGHTRFFQQNWFGFLSQKFYERNDVLGSCFTDYRFAWHKDFDVLYMQEHGGHHLAVVLGKPE